jgi:LAS superfamily LD-carboxypeptidase LdcB
MSYPRKAVLLPVEPWHYRYLGRDQAAAIHEAGVAPREWFWDHGYGVR